MIPNTAPSPATWYCFQKEELSELLLPLPAVVLQPSASEPFRSGLITHIYPRVLTEAPGVTPGRVSWGPGPMPRHYLYRTPTPGEKSGHASSSSISKKSTRLIRLNLRHILPLSALQWFFLTQRTILNGFLLDWTGFGTLSLLWPIGDNF